jgi:glutamate---cysteine ligase / carboxylate-amine ligase
MSVTEQPFTIGIEEEYLLVDRESRDLRVSPPSELIHECEALLTPETGGVTSEFLRSQIEVETSVCTTIQEARGKLSELRSAVSHAAGEHGLAPIAASTHPFASWTDQQHTDKERYNHLAEDLQAVAHRLLICGMHVHVGIDDDDLRIDLLNQASYFLPHLLALSTSSRFWQGRDTGLMSYRLSVFDELPRTGLPERFESYGEYRRHLEMLVHAGLIEDGTKIWWDIRPSWKYPTLEMRITDVCTRMDDSITIAALFSCLLSMLMRLRRDNQRWRRYANMLVQENRWRAQRYGVMGELVDFGKGALVPYADLLDELLALVHEDAERLQCLPEIENARDILARGTSAQRQIMIYEAALQGGEDSKTALNAVVDWLIEETTVGVSP